MNSTISATLDPTPKTANSEIISVSHLSKTYDTGLLALNDINLKIRKGEIFALLGPNGAGKTTLIGIICGTVRPSHGQVKVGGYDTIRQYRHTRSMIGLVPQELMVDIFVSPWATVSISRGLFGKSPNSALVERILRDLSLWDKRKDHIKSLSGGMKRRVMIAKALVHEPDILFLDEPTAGVDVELRRDMWKLIRHLRETGVTIILTTHYIEEAEEMADRIGVIHKGELIVVEDKATLLRKLGKKQLVLTLQAPIGQIPAELKNHDLAVEADGKVLRYTYDVKSEGTGIATLLTDLHAAGIRLSDLNTDQSSLEEIFVQLVKDSSQ